MSSFRANSFSLSSDVGMRMCRLGIMSPSYDIARVLCRYNPNDSTSNDAAAAVSISLRLRVANYPLKDNSNG